MPAKKLGPLDRTVDSNLFGDEADYNNPEQTGWEGVNAGIIGGFVKACCHVGVACIFTSAMRGKALGVVILNGDEKLRKYFNDSQSMEDYLAATSQKLTASLVQEANKRRNT